MTTLKDDIIRESIRPFSFNGFLSTGINDILQAASTSKGGFYNHFSSKEDLFYQVLAEVQKIWRATVLMGLFGIESPAGKIKKLLTN